VSGKNANLSPAIKWSGAPEGTQSIALILGSRAGQSAKWKNQFGPASRPWGKVSSQYSKKRKDQNDFGFKPQKFPQIRPRSARGSSVTFVFAPWYGG
jgi:hypothetical protein